MAAPAPACAAVDHRAGRLKGAVAVDADQLDGVVVVRRHGGVRIAVSRVKGCDAGRAVERVKAARAVECRVYGLEGAVVVHLDQLDGVVQERRHNYKRLVAHAQHVDRARAA